MVAARRQRGEHGGRRRRIAQAYREVAQPAGIARAPDRRTFGAAQEFVLVPCEQLDERRAVEAVANAEVALLVPHRELVPRARELAVVAAEHAVADQRPQLLGNRVLQLDREVGDAAPRVDAVGRDDRAGRADVDAARAGAAVRARRRVDRQRQVGVDLAEEEPAAGAAVDQAAVLADPAQARVAGERALEHRRRIGEHAVAERTGVGGDAVGELLQPAAQHLVVVAAQRVARDVRPFAVGERAPRVRVVAGAVVHARGDHPQRAGDEFVGARALVTVPRHVVHRPVLALREPVAQVRLVVAEFDAGDADLLEAEFAAPLLDAFGEGGQVGHPRKYRIHRMSELLPLYRPAQVRAMDQHAIAQLGAGAMVLMDRAGAAAWALLRERWPDAGRIGVACGPGNNGGDGYVVARLAKQHGLAVRVVSP